MRNVISILLFLCAVTTSTAQRLRVGDGTSGMRITREYNNVSLSDALRQLNAESTDYEINFIYNELEDFRITTTIRRHRRVSAENRQPLQGHHHRRARPARSLRQHRPALAPGLHIDYWWSFE